MLAGLSSKLKQAQMTGIIHKWGSSKYEENRETRSVGVLPIMGDTRRLHPKGPGVLFYERVPFQMVNFR